MTRRAYNKIICLDFDGVINNYKGWRNEGFNVVLDKPLQGARDAIWQLRKDNKVIVHSTRCSHRGGRRAVIDWLKKYNIEVDEVVANKPLADIYVDDRGVSFDGNWKRALRRISRFRHWTCGKTGVAHVAR